MFNSFFNWLQNKIEKARYEDNKQPKAAISPISSEKADFDRRKSLNFNVYYASGGMIVETRTYDKKTDEWSNELHIVTEDQDLSDFLARIITIRMLTR